MSYKQLWPDFIGVFQTTLHGIPIQYSQQTSPNYEGSFILQYFLHSRKRTRKQKIIDIPCLKTGAYRISQEEALEILKEISLPNTTWSVVYNLTMKEIPVVPAEKYDHTYRYHLIMKKEY